MISNVINRTDDVKVYLIVKNLNNHLISLDLDIVDNSNIGKECLGKKGLHLIEKMPQIQFHQYYEAQMTQIHLFLKICSLKKYAKQNLGNSPN